MYIRTLFAVCIAYLAGVYTKSCCNTTLPFTTAHRLFNFHQWPDTFVVYHLQVLASN